MSTQHHLPRLLETQRLRLRLLTPDDAPELNSAISESYAELQPWMPWAKEPPSLAATQAFCDEAGRRFEEAVGLDLLLEDARTGALIGASGYPRLNWQIPSFEIGYWCRTRHTGSGFASEATAALAEYAFSELDAARVELVIDSANEASTAVARRLGFRREALLQNHSRNTAGQLCDTSIFALTRRSELISFQPR